MSRVPRVAVGLAVVFVLTLASSDPVDLGLGLVLGVALAWALRDRLRLAPGGVQPSFLQRMLWTPVFVAGVLVDVIRGTWDVALRVVGLRSLDDPGILRIPIGDRTDRGVAVSALATTLSPGSLLIDIDWENRDLLLHVMDASDPDKVRDQLQRFYDRYQRRVFP